MSYAQRKQISGNRTLAIILVALIQFGLGYAIVTDKRLDRPELGVVLV